MQEYTWKTLNWWEILYSATVSPRCPSRSMRAKSKTRKPWSTMRFTRGPMTLHQVTLLSHRQRKKSIWAAILLTKMQRHWLQVRSWKRTTQISRGWCLAMERKRRRIIVRIRSLQSLVHVHATVKIKMGELIRQRKPSLMILTMQPSQIFSKQSASNTSKSIRINWRYLRAHPSTFRCSDCRRWNATRIPIDPGSTSMAMARQVSWPPWSRRRTSRSTRSRGNMHSYKVKDQQSSRYFVWHVMRQLDCQMALVRGQTSSNWSSRASGSS